MSFTNQPQTLEIETESDLTSDSIDNKKAESKKIIASEDEYVFGNHISKKRPYKMGKLITCLYIGYTPIIAIGLEKSKLTY